ncbi:MAG: glycogen debranching protein GlgX [Caldilineaceae bacterium]|nr:glycogen debranching protein GlgX [Caldilineaceae bacterium]
MPNAPVSSAAARDHGKSYPIGATVEDGGVNFSLHSRTATGIDLLLFDGVDDPRPARVIPLDSRRNRTRNYWHIFVAGIQNGQIYAFRAHGPQEPVRGLRFDPDKVLLDPYGRGIAVPSRFERLAAARPGDNTIHAMKSVVVDTSRYDWEGDEPLRRPFHRTVIYEMHVRGFTRHYSAGLPAATAGTYAGLTEKIPYLVDLGVTAVELLPVFQFDPQDAPAGRVNYWGYSPVSFFAPHLPYSSRPDALSTVDEFRDMVKALHRAGIEVILDVVYNHTAEGDAAGPTFCFRGLDNEIYYILERDKATYANYSGTGNTLNANQSQVRRMILDSLHYWVEEMHVDGFRFDLASILSRDEQGHPLANPPILWDIENDPVLAGTKLIAEAWDAAGLYQVGSFVGDHWKEWNGRFRDDVRAFVKSNSGMADIIAPRLFGSPDIFGFEERGPDQSINLVTCHDGFTLNDLVSYNEKHNMANGEANRDGHNDNLSWNCGVEGPTDDPAVEQLRQRQIKNLMAITLLSLGVPMILMGDEMRRTQFGNNNAYCQDNATSWMDWTLLEQHADIHRFVRALIHLRLGLFLYREVGALSLIELLMTARIEWHGTRLNQPDTGYDSRTLAMLVAGTREALYVICNAYWAPLDFELPPPPFDGVASWRRVIDTYAEAPHDIYALAAAPPVAGKRYHVHARSSVLLIAERPRKGTA